LFDAEMISLDLLCFIVLGADSEDDPSFTREFEEFF
jgi:hypothetical protein